MQALGAVASAGRRRARRERRPLVGGGGVELRGRHLDGERESVEALHDADHHGVPRARTDRRRSFRNSCDAGDSALSAGAARRTRRARRRWRPVRGSWRGHRAVGPPARMRSTVAATPSRTCSALSSTTSRSRAPTLGMSSAAGRPSGARPECGDHDVGYGGGVLDRCEFDHACAELTFVGPPAGQPRGRDGSCQRRPAR